MIIAQVMIFVHDLGAAKRFYTDILGLKIKQDLSAELDMLILENGQTILTIHGGFDRLDYNEGRKISVTFSVQDIKAKVAELQSKGVQLIGEIEETPVHWFQGMVDPSGNLIEIGQYK